jgi:hypothetical protein
MRETRVDSRASIAGGWAGAPEEAQLPVQVPKGSPRPDGAHAARPRKMEASAAAPRSRIHFALRMVRDAAIAVALMTLVPVGIVGVWGDSLWRTNFGNTREKLAQIETSRPLSLPTDPSITPDRAGLALGALVQERGPDFPARVAPPAEASWRGATLAPGMFPTARPVSFNGPSSGGILEAAQKGLTPAEMAFLKTLATAPVWKEYDILVRAPAADLVGGRFRIPFGAGVNYSFLPNSRFTETKELAYAAVSRAAWHLANGRRDSAETVLRSIASYGFVLTDNGTTVMDELIGSVIVGIGRDALRRFYVITGDPRAASAAVAAAPRLAWQQQGGRALNAATTGELRTQLLERAADPSASRGERFEDLGKLAVSECTNVRELMFGARPDVSDAFRRARQELARYPAEQALLDMEARRMDGIARSLGTLPAGNVFSRLAASTAAVAGAVLQNPRLLTCTRLIIEGRGTVY